uniref:uncharacterized protein LOC122604436 n=1 Tax=Erigeron canadensis TaxID=72917 RepID=UPI001CB9281B|nr:uncharacterized protein LOC122604436 [Erigeron canadensis]
MSIDKSWTTLDRRSDEFWFGLSAFIERCKDHMTNDGLCRCPCERCENLEWQSLQKIQLHIHSHGFSEHFPIWKFHGKPVVLPIEHSIPQTRGQLHDFLADVRQETHDYEHTTRIDDPMNTTQAPSTNDELDELLKLADLELYPGNNWISSLEFLARLNHLKATSKWTNTSFDGLLSLLKFSMPKQNTIPVSHYDAKKILDKVGLGYQNIDVCKNDCCIFWGDHLKDEVCWKCSESRWIDKNTTGTKVAHKVMRYFSLTPRLKRLYNSRHTAKDMTWHATGQCTEVGKMHHPVDGTTWKGFDKRYPDFASEPRNVRLGLAADGFNPFGNMSVSYSMWPVILTTYNMPPWLCMKESTFMLTLLIPGPKSPGRDMDIFLRPLVEELKSLWSCGVKTQDASTNTTFTMRAMLLWTINDFPARSSLSGWSGQGYLTCPTCAKDTPSCRVHGKTAYVGHRMYLKVDHPWRQSLSFDGKIETRRPPKKKTRKTILAQVNRLPHHPPGKHPLFGGKKRKRDPKIELNWSKRSIFFELEYWPFLELKHNLDVMHIEKNVCESLLNTLLMHKEKSKDTNKARMVLKEWGIREELWLRKTKDGRVVKPHPKYSFSVQDITLFCQFIKGVGLPDGFGSNFSNKVTDNDSKLTGLKSHDHHIMMQRLLPLGVRAYLDSDMVDDIRHGKSSS